jgi:hypothetical protein
LWYFHTCIQCTLNEFTSCNTLSYPPFPLFINNFNGLIYFHTGIWSTLIIFTPLCPFHSPFLFLLVLTSKHAPLHFILYHFFRSRFQIWESTAIFVFLSLAFFHLTWFPVPSIFLQMTSFQSFWLLIHHCMYYIFFIHSSIDGHLGWFHNLAKVNSAAKNMSIQVLYTDLHSFTKMVWQDHMVAPLFSFWGTSILISIVAALIYILNNNV